MQRTPQVQLTWCVWLFFVPVGGGARANPVLAAVLAACGDAQWSCGVTLFVFLTGTVPFPNGASTRDACFNQFYYGNRDEFWMNFVPLSDSARGAASCPVLRAQCACVALWLSAHLCHVLRLMAAIRAQTLYVGCLCWSPPSAQQWQTCCRIPSWHLQCPFCNSGCCWCCSPNLTLAVWLCGRSSPEVQAEMNRRREVYPSLKAEELAELRQRAEAKRSVRRVSLACRRLADRLSVVCSGVLLLLWVCVSVCVFLWWQA